MTERKRTAAPDPHQKPPLETPQTNANTTDADALFGSALAGALECARRGWHVFPADGPDAGGKQPAPVAPGRRFAFTTGSTTDPDTIRDWRLDERGLNFGVYAAGSDLVVLDEDRDGAVAEWADALGIALPPTFTVASGRGRHWYYRAEGVEFPQRDPWPGVNVRHRGYVVGPGSIHATGALYSVVDDRDPAALPAGAVEALLAKPEPPEAPAHAAAPRSASDAAYGAAVVRGALADVAALAELREGERLTVTAADGTTKALGWEEGSGLQSRARRIVEGANAAGDAYPLAAARDEFLALAPHGAEARWRHHWADAVAHVGSRAAERPSRDHAADFADLGPAGTAHTDDDALAGIRSRYPLKNLRALLDPDRPPRPWVVEDFWPAEASVSLIAPAGIGKSLFALSLAVAVARGDAEFAGLAIPERRRVLYVDWENGEYDYVERLTALGFTQDNVGVLDGWFMPLELPDSLPKLDTAEGRRDLGLLIDAYGLERHDLVVLDSAQRMVGGPENDSDTWRAFYDHTALMLKARGMSVMRMDNTGHQDASRSRGSSSKRDDVDAQWVIKVPRNAGPGTFDFVATKGRMKDGLPLLTFYRRTVDGALRWETDRSPRGHRTDAARRWLDEHGAAPEWGQDRAWEFAKERSCPHPRALVREAQQRRKADAQAALDDFDEVPE